MTSFRALVTSHTELTEELPLIHTSRCEFLSSISTTHALEPQPCRVFHESLIYLFYGRPAYRSNRGNMGGEPIVLCPVCFVFRPRTVSQLVHRIYPCDTGAVAANRFIPEILASDLAQLVLDPQIDSARRLVNLLFERNSDYFVGKVVQTRTFTPGCVEARFYQLLMRAGPVDYDDRKSAIEVQVTPSHLSERPTSVRGAAKRILRGRIDSRCHHQYLELRSSGVCYIQGRCSSRLLLSRT